MSMIVIGHSLLTKIKSVQSDVRCLLTCIDGDGILVQWCSRIELPGIQSRIRIESFQQNNEWVENKKNRRETKVEQRKNENRK
jgi:hypothetical protein